ncbi:chorismate mutase [Catenulispora pinisilvae]|uniref:chorismate mutase n=1 Tax=Catenulispora pinisilvae TaxID=2705253 RepID=UPI001890EAF8|nr:chorismate mutase [Catenulispora pinisilvae]
MTASATADSTSADRTSPDRTSADSAPGAALPGEPVVSVPGPLHVAVPVSATSAASAGTAASAVPAAVEQTGQPTPAGVLTGRARIDDLDARILALITERVGTAADIQSARIAEGGRRLDLKRETEIITRYRETLGRPGVTIAMAVLELCRGRV